MVSTGSLPPADRTLLIEMFCCVIAADKRVSGKEVQIVVDALGGMGCDTTSGALKEEVVGFCKAIHKRGVDAYVADLLPTLTTLAGKKVAVLFIDAQPRLLEADGQATSDERIISECLVTALQHPIAEGDGHQEADIVLEDVAPSGTAAVASAAKSTAALAGAAAERTKLMSISLPAAYLALGKHCVEKRLFSQDFPDLYAALSKLADEMAVTSEKLNRASVATTLAGKAQDLAGKGVQLALTKKQGLQRQKLLHDFGKKAYEAKGAISGPGELTTKIAQIKERIEALGASVGNSAQSLKQSAAAAGRSASQSIEGARKRGWLRSPWVIGAGIALFVLGLIGSSMDKPDDGGGKRPTGGEYKIRLGMTPREVVGIMGKPDFEMRSDVPSHGNAIISQRWNRGSGPSGFDFAQSIVVTYFDNGSPGDGVTLVTGNGKVILNKNGVAETMDQLDALLSK
jgi:hypothetical protein